MPSMPSFCAGTQARGVEEPTLGRRCHRALRSGEKLPRNDRFCEALFLVSGLTAIVCLLVASFCGIRWAMLPVPNSTVGHIESTRADMKSFTAAELIRAYERNGEDSDRPRTSIRLQNQ